jgi:translation initiation factor IF-3
MAKIFRRESLQKLKKKKRKKKENNRVRNKYVNFRVTSDEYDLLNKKVEMSGLLKQDYIIQCLLNSEVKVKLDYRLADKIAKEIFQLARVIKKYGQLDDQEQEILIYILEIYEELKKEKSL